MSVMFMIVLLVVVYGFLRINLHITQMQAAIRLATAPDVYAKLYSDKFKKTLATVYYELQQAALSRIVTVCTIVTIVVSWMAASFNQAGTAVFAAMSLTVAAAVMCMWRFSSAPRWMQQWGKQVVKTHYIVATERLEAEVEKINKAIDELKSDSILDAYGQDTVSLYLADLLVYRERVNRTIQANKEQLRAVPE